MLQEDWNPRTRSPTRVHRQVILIGSKASILNDSSRRKSRAHHHIDVNGPSGATRPVSDQPAIVDAAGGRTDSGDNVAPCISSDDGATTPGGPVMVTTLVVVAGVIVWWRRRRQR